MKKVIVEGNLLCIGNMQISFENKIMQVKQEENYIFVLLNIPPKKELSYNDCHNLYCYDSAGNRIWQIGERPNGDDIVFTMVNIIDSSLYANDFLGRRFWVDKCTGIIGGMNITK